MSARILICKLTFLAKLLANPGDIISDRIFSSLVIVDTYSTSIVQQCRMLESALGTYVLAECLENPQDTPSIVRSCKERILKRDFDLLLTLLLTIHCKTHGLCSPGNLMVPPMGLCTRMRYPRDSWPAATTEGVK